MKLKNKCPKCEVLLNPVLICDHCNGSLMGLAVLDAVAPRGFQKKCVENARAHGHVSKRECPTCSKNMIAATLPDSKVELDYCLDCQQVWFDAGEISQLPKKTEVDKALQEAERMVSEAQRAGRIAQKEAELARLRANLAMMFR